VIFVLFAYTGGSDMAPHARTPTAANFKANTRSTFSTPSLATDKGGDKFTPPFFDVLEGGDNELVERCNLKISNHQSSRQTQSLY
jgi:hypothetical protein